MWQYAVIVVRTEPPCERLVIAYSDENILRDLVAAPSIVELGYPSREEAQANIDRWTTYPSRQKRPATVVTTTRTDKTVVANHECPTGGFDLAGTWNLICDFLRHSFAVAIVVLFSKNVLSVVVRGLISF